MRTHNPSILGLCLLLFFASLSTGCFWFTTKHEGKRLRTDVDKLESRVATRETDLESKIAQLETVLDKATKVLRRNSADLGADFETVKHNMRAAEGLIEEARHEIGDVRDQIKALEQKMDNDRAVMAQRLDSLDQRLAALEADKNKRPEPANPGELYARAKSAFDSGDYKTARQLFKEMVVRFPGHSRADDSQYYRAEAYFKEADYEGAIREFQRVFDKYKASSLADDALYRAGEAAQRLKRCAEARAYFGLLRKKYPKSSLARKARDKDKEIKKVSRNKRKCL